MYEWSDEQKGLRKGLEQYTEALSAGHVEDDAAARFPRERWDVVRDTGVLRLPFAEAYGGLGHDALTLCYVLEHLGYLCRDSGLLFSVATQLVSAAIPIQKFGSEGLKDRWLADLVGGTVLSAHAISEPDAGSDATAMTTTATEDGDEWVIDGEKAYCTSGPIADLITVYARTDTGSGVSGISAILVPADTPGLTVGEPIPKMGLNTSPIGGLTFDGCRVPSSNLLGRPGAGFFVLEHVMTWEVLCIFIMMVGEMQHRMERCIAYAKERHQFGQPIGANQYVAGMIVDQKAGVETSRKHLYDAAYRFSKRRSVIAEASLCKLIVSEANLKSATSAVQIFGGRGYMQADGLEKDLRAAVGAPIYSGTNEVQRVRVAAMLGLPTGSASKSGWT